MQEHKYDELRSETAREMSDELFGANAHQRAEQALKAAIARKVEQMTADGRAFTLTDEEERIIKSFRRFKANCKKDGEVFKWQTGPRAGPCPDRLQKGKRVKILCRILSSAGYALAIACNEPPPWLWVAALVVGIVIGRMV